MKRKKILFVCVGNAYRSIIAEAYGRKFLDAEVESAGVRPLGYIPSEVVDVLKEDGVEVEGLFSKPIDLQKLKDYDIIVILSRMIFFAPEGKKVMFFDIEDPASSDIEFLRKIRDQIKNFVLSLKAELET
jgi:arsenate reductase